MRRKLKKPAPGKKQTFSTKDLQFYVETDTVHKIITIGMKHNKILLDMMQAKSLMEILNHQIQLLSDK